jgi:hypothetical protein
MRLRELDSHWSSYGANLGDAYRQAGVYLIFSKARSPADLPVMQLSKFEPAINLDTAKTLDRTIPPGVLANADEVVE